MIRVAVFLRPLAAVPILLFLLLAVGCSQTGYGSEVMVGTPAVTAIATIVLQSTSTSDTLTLAAEPQSQVMTATAAAPLFEPEVTATLIADNSSATVQPEPTPTPFITAMPDNTAIPTHTATSTPTAHPFALPDPALPTPATPIPTPVAPFETSPDIVNIMLLGNDIEWAQGGRTDSIIIVSVNRQTKTATMLSLPRDLYVYIPGWTMNRINLAMAHGYGADYPGGGGALLKDTILYNFGISVDYYVRVGFNGFKQVVDTMGGVEVVVSCPLRDWRLKEPDLDPTEEDNWEQFTLESGIHTMDGDLALWYVRSRRSTNDFERGRRQQQVLRAIMNQATELGLLAQLPRLWETYRDNVETDLTLPTMLELAALVPAVRDNGVQHLYLTGNTIKGWRVPTTGEAVQLIQWEAAQATFQQLLQPPLLNRGTRPPITVEVVTSNDVLYRMAADNLAWQGFVPVRGYRDGFLDPPHTRISYYAPNFKGSFNWLLGWVFNQPITEIELVSDETSAYNYRVDLGTNYNPCRPQLEAPHTGSEEP